MRKGTLLTLSTALAVSMFTAIPVLADDTVYGQVNAYALNVRAGGTADDEIIGDLAEADEVAVTDRLDNGWYKIEYDGQIAYVNGEYIDIYGESDNEDADESYDDSEDTSDEASYDESADDSEAADETEETAGEAEESSEETAASTWNGPVLNRSNGTVQGPSGKETYYNLDMSGVVNIMRNMGNADEYWVREDGVKMLGDYIMCAANLDVHPRGSLVESSLGTCIVCDTGGFAYSNPNQLDIAVNW
ncbi:MAG: SH3 domain-containing protein [Eubacterium sp.]|nr:SH3 domain-containing protein [Eubacterium sp.]